MHTINIEQIPSTENGVSHLLKRHKKTVRPRFILLSLLAHSVVVLLILGKLHFSDIDDQADSEIDPIEQTSIKSYLFIPLPKVSPAEPALEKQQEKVSEAKTTDSAIAIKQASEEVPTPIDETPLKSDLTEEAPSVRNDFAFTESDQDKVQQPPPISKYGSRDSIRKQLKNIEANKLGAIAESASREYSTSLVSPTIDAPYYSNEYLYSKEPGVHMITCDDNIKNKLKLLTGLMGGKIKCREKDFQKHIDKYLKKELE